MESFRPEKRAENMSHDFQELVNELSEITNDTDLQVEEVDDTFEIESDYFNLTFTIDQERFEIRNIDVRNNEGLGSQIVTAIHEFADERDLEVIASNVKDTAPGFWRKMGYQEGDSTDEYFRAA